VQILVLEDRGTVAEYLEETLREAGHIVHSCFNVLDARSALSDSIDCLIIDLNMPAEGLTKEQIAQTNAGMFTGWIWLRDEVYSNKPALREATIIYSDYLTQFRKEEQMKEEDVTGVTMIGKRDGNGAKKLLAAVATIEAKQASREREHG